MSSELKLLMTRLSEFSLSWPSARNELNMTHFICSLLFFYLLFSVAKLISSVRQYLWGITGLHSVMMDRS